MVVPTYCEAGNVAELARRVELALSGISYEIIFVDDDSPDGTTDVVRALALADPRVRILRRVGRRGLSGAAIEGALSTTAPVVVVMDADLQHDETLLPAMLATIQDGADMVVASRYAEGSTQSALSRARGWGSRVATRWVQRLLKVNATDPLSGFFMLRREHWDAFAPRLERDGFKIQMDILSLAQGRLKLAEVPTALKPRHSGESKLDALVTLQFGGLLVSRATGGFLPPPFILFALVGTTGIGTHLIVLHVLTLAGVAFIPAQTIAALIAMTGNFVLNNAITYRAQRLKGARFWRGLLSFYAVCSIGVVGNVGVGTLVLQSDAPVIIAGLAGAVMSAVFNYAASRALTWRQG